MNVRAVLGLVFVVAVALFLRVGDLAFRPLHNDEAINAVKLERLWKTGEYRYDPHEYHGPALYYLALPVARWHEAAGGGPDEAGMRWFMVWVGIAIILVSLLWVDGVGWRSGWFAGLWLAVSPAFVYYSRYFIHELLLVFFSAAAIGAGWRYVNRPGLGWAMMFGAAVGMMYATKETFVFSLLAMGSAAAGVLIWEGGRESDPGRLRMGAWRRVVAWLRCVPPMHTMSALIAAVGVWAALFTSFFTHPAGALDSFKTYWIWFERAGGASPHIHPWWFYWERLGWFHERGGPVWSEAAILVLAGVGGILAIRATRMGNAERRLARFLLLYTVILAAIYTALPYKTPWCLLGFYHGAVLLAGVAVQGLLELRRGVMMSVGTGLIVAVASGHLGWQAWRATREYGADYRNPYVYGHTAADVTNLLEQVREVAAADPAGRSVRVNVMAPESNYWPLPWYLRDFGQVGWWDRIPEEPYAPIMVVASRLKADFETKSNQAWLMVGLFELRPRVFVELYVEAGLWERFLAARRAARAAGIE